MKLRLSTLFLLPALLASPGCDDEGTAIDPDPDATVEAETDAAPSPDAAQAAPYAPNCQSETHFDWQPGGDNWGVFPDDYYMQQNAGTATGLQVDLSMETAPWLARAGEGYRNVFLQMNQLDGWGTAAPIFLTFDADLAEPLDPTFLQVVESETGTAVPSELQLLEDKRTVLVWPFAPLRPATAYAVLVSSDLETESGDCVAPNNHTTVLLNGSAQDPNIARLVPNVAAAIEAAGADANTLAGVIHFTTQSIHESSSAIADEIAGREFEWDGPLDCEGNMATARTCTGTFTAIDYRHDGVITGRAGTEYQIPATIWLPPGQGPFPVWIVGHGLGGDRNQGSALRQLASGADVAVVAIDAVGHGQHPSGVPSNQVQFLLEFFAIDLAGRSIDALKLRDTFRQSTFDRLQLYKLIKDQPDVLGNETPEFDLDRMGYFGISLGAIMASEFLAFTDGIEAVTLGMPGGRLTRLVRDNQAFSILGDALFPQGSTSVERERYLAAVQAVIDRADPVNYAGHLVENRLPGHEEDKRPDILMMMAMDDETVSNSSTEALLRAMQSPLIDPPEKAVSHLPEPVSTPAEANLNDRSVAMIQLKTVTYNGRREFAAHNSVLGSAESVDAFTAFVESWLRDGRAQIIDPR